MSKQLQLSASRDLGTLDALIASMQAQMDELNAKNGRELTADDLRRADLRIRTSQVVIVAVQAKTKILSDAPEKYLEVLPNERALIQQK